MSQELLSRLLAVTTRMGDDMQRGLSALGLTEARAHLLWELSAMEAPTQRRLAEALRISPRAVTALVDGLEASGHLRRAAHPADRRAVVVELTEPGRDAVRRLRADFAALAAELFRGLPAEELDTFGRVLDAVAGRLPMAAPPEDAGR